MLDSVGGCQVFEFLDVSVQIRSFRPQIWPRMAYKGPCLQDYSAHNTCRPCEAARAALVEQVRSAPPALAAVWAEAIEREWS